MHIYNSLKSLQWMEFLTAYRSYLQIKPSVLQKKNNFVNFLQKSICCGYSLEAPHWGASNEYSQHRLPWKNKKNNYLYILFVWSCVLIVIDTELDLIQV